MTHHATLGTSREVLREHYDLPVDFFRLWIGPRLLYSGAIWRDGDSLAQAQRRRLDYWAEQVRLDACESVLDVGCGWGGVLADFVDRGRLLAAVGLTLGEAHRDHCRRFGPPQSVELLDWRDHDVEATYDAVLTIDALEHFVRAEVSDEQRIDVYSTFFGMAWRWLRPSGRIGLQVTTVGDGLDPRSSQRPVPEFIHGDILGETSLPHLHELLIAAEPHFDLVAVRDHTADYVKTLRAWYGNLRREAAAATEIVGDDVVAKFLAYLGTCEVAFRRRDCELHLFTFARRDERLARH